MDLNRYNPFTVAAASFADFRPIDIYNGIPTHLLHHLHPQFLHSSLAFSTAASATAFQPLIDSKSFQSPSAFTPPNKCAKLTASTMASMVHDNINNNHPKMAKSPSCEDAYADGAICMRRSPSPSCATGRLSRASSCDANASKSCSTDSSGGQVDVKMESFEAGNAIDDGECSGGNSLAARASPMSPAHQPRIFRVDSLYSSNERGYNLSASHDYSKGPYYEHGNKRDTSSCPVCGVSIQSGELESHFLQELEKLCKLSCVRNLFDGASLSQTVPDHRWEIFERIRSNRQDRLKSKHRKRKFDEVTCPICGHGIHIDSNEINMHILQCLRKQRMQSPCTPDEDETVDIEGDTKLYVQSAWPNAGPPSRGSSIFSVPTSSHNTQIEVDVDDAEEEDLIVDADDQASQCSDTDAASAHSGVPSRDTLLSPDDNQQVATVNSSVDVDVKPEPRHTPCDSNVSTSVETGPGNRLHLLRELKAKIRELEEGVDETGDANKSDVVYKCFVCHDNYKDAVISINCWHVHCEKCWFQIMESKNEICPQCNNSTTSSDLKRIFI